MSELSNGTKKHTSKFRETIPLNEEFSLLFLYGIWYIVSVQQGPVISELNYSWHIKWTEKIIYFIGIGLLGFREMYVSEFWREVSETNLILKE
jgi:hypothetical protein